MNRSTMTHGAVGDFGHDGGDDGDEDDDEKRRGDARTQKNVGGGRCWLFWS